MEQHAGERVDWRALRASGDLGRFVFISLGILLHATNETMIATIMPAMVREIEGVEFVGWSLAIYELGSIVAGAAAGRLVSYMPLRRNMAGAAMIYAAGAAICAASPEMTWFLVGRMVEGLGGGALVALAFVSVERLFPQRIWPQLFAIMSAVWGVAAFSGPLLGALIAEAFSWRWAFGVFSAGGLVMAGACFVVLRGPRATTRSSGDAPPPFPYLTLAVLAGSVMLIAYAGVVLAFTASSILFALGVAGLGVFLALDARKPASRLFPSRPFDWGSPLGAGMTMIAAFAIGTSCFFLYAPLILTGQHGIAPLTAGYIVAAESISWSVMAILIANVTIRRERRVIMVGALGITTGVVGFAYAVPAGSIPLILACAILQGGGFGIAWPFVTRLIVASAPADESTVAASAIPTLQRMGYAVGSAFAGIVANAAGFSGGYSGDTAASVAFWLFLAFIPFGLVGLLAAARVAAR